MFCTECGAYLLRGDGRGAQGTAELPFSEAVQAIPDLQLVGQQLAPDCEVTRIMFVIPASGRRVTLALKDEIRIGRADPGSSQRPDLNLAPDGANEFGVSRRHATIRRSDEGIMVLDLESTNGTYLNGYRVPPELPYLLRSGAEIRFGYLLVHIFFE